MQALEEVLSQLSLFKHLRPDEIGRVARHFVPETLAEGERRDFTADAPRMVVVVGGRASLGTDEGIVARLDPGDCHGELALLTGHVQPFHVLAVGRRPSPPPTARRSTPSSTSSLPSPSRSPTSSRASSAPATTPCASSSSCTRRDCRRRELAAAVDERRLALARRGARVRRLSPRAIFRRLVTHAAPSPRSGCSPASSPRSAARGWWSSLILKYHLEKRLFALVQGTDPNPMHVHHFNYGFILIGAPASPRSSPSGAGAAGAGVRVRRRCRASSSTSSVDLESPPGIRESLELDLGGIGRRALPPADLFPPLLARARPSRLARLPGASMSTSPSAWRSSARSPYLASVDDDTLGELAARASGARYRPTSASCAELESGADVYVVLGRGRGLRRPRAGERQVSDARARRRRSARCLRSPASCAPRRSPRSRRSRSWSSPTPTSIACASVDPRSRSRWCASSPRRLAESRARSMRSSPPRRATSRASPRTSRSAAGPSGARGESWWSIVVAMARSSRWSLSSPR